MGGQRGRGRYKLIGDVTAILLLTRSILHDNIYLMYVVIPWSGHRMIIHLVISKHSKNLRFESNRTSASIVTGIQLIANH